MACFRPLGRLWWLSLLLGYAYSQSIAIVGAGIGGAASAYFVSEVIGANPSITVFERTSRLGGRIENFTFNGTIPLEIGASILYTGNMHLRQIAETLGLHPRAPVHTGGTFGIWDGANLVYRSYEFKPWTVITLLARYRLMLWRLMGTVRQALERFMQIYDLQRRCSAYETPQELWKALGLLDLTQVSLREYLASQGVGQADSQLVGELVGAVNRVNYNQDNGLNALAGVVSLCPMVTGEVWTVAEGNSQMIDAMLRAAKATIRLNTAVGSVRVVVGEGESTSSQYVLVDTDGVHLGTFDAVILAAPLALSGIRLVDNKEEQGGAVSGAGEIIGGSEQARGSPLPPREYVTTHSTFIRGRLRETYFHVAEGAEAPSSVYLKENTSSPISSLSLHIRVNATHGVYKLFSSAALDASFLQDLFIEWELIEHRKWLAYPRFHPPEEMAPFVPLPGHRIYYVNALEAAVSAMEISAIAAKNIALLLGHSYGHCGVPGRQRQQQDEL